MIPRRSLLTGGVLGGVLGALGAGDDVEAAPAPAVGADVNDEMVSRIVQAIAGLRTEVQGLRSFSEIAAVRDAQVSYLRTNGRFPDYIEVGTTIWFALHDWHIRWQQPLTLGRDNLGRYTLLLNATTVIMRTDTAANFMGLPYDNR
jgi:hypothetical protein